MWEINYRLKILIIMSLVIGKQEFKNVSFKPPTCPDGEEKTIFSAIQHYIDRSSAHSKTTTTSYQYKFYTGSPRLTTIGLVKLQQH